MVESGGARGDEGCRGQKTTTRYDDDMLTPTGYPPQHSNRHGPQRTQHTASTAATPRSPQGRRQYPCRRAGPTQTVYARPFRRAQTQVCQLPSKRLEDITPRQSGERLPESRCFLEDKGLLCQLSSKRLEQLA